MTVPGEPLRHETAEGLRLVVAPLPSAHRVAIDVRLGAGPLYEAPRERGLSHFLEHMLFRGIPSAPSAHEQALGFERLGGTLAAATYVDHGNVELAVPPETFTPAVALLGETYREPLFTRLEVERGIVREEILELYDDQGQLIDSGELLMGLSFEGHALAMPITGRYEDVEAFTERRVRAHHRRLYTSDNTVVAVTGPVRPSAVLRLFERHFAGLPRGRVRPKPAPPRQRAPRWRYVRHELSQTELRVGFRAPGEGEAAEPATELLVRVLDDGMSTRLYHRICDERGLCYDVSASYEAYRGVGLFDVMASAAHERTPEVLDLILGLLEQLREEGPTEAELDKAKRRVQWQLDELLDDPPALASFLALGELSGVGRSPRERLEQLRAVSRREVQAAAQRCFQAAGMSIVAVGRSSPAEQRRIERRITAF